MRRLLSALKLGLLTVSLGFVASHVAPGRMLGQGRSDPALMTISRTGEVLNETSTTAIFWGPEWIDPDFAGDSFKCDGIFPPADYYFLFSNGSEWVIRAKWSNAAYLAGTGLPNAYGLPGCVY